MVNDPHRRHDRPHPQRRRAQAAKVLTPGLEAAPARARRAAGRRLHPRLHAACEKPGDFPQFEIELKYFDGQPVIAEIARVSKPGRRVYSSIGDLKPVKNGLGISILSTPKGVMSDTAARDANVGGEVLCQRVLGEPCRVSARKPIADPRRRHRHARRADRHREGAQGPARLDGGRRDRSAPGRWRT